MLNFTDTHKVVIMFPIPLISLKVGVEGIYDFFNKEIRHRDDKITRDNEHNKNLTHWYNDSNVLYEYKELATLREEIEAGANFAYKDVLNYKKSGDMKVVQSWFNLAQVGATQFPHNHVNSVMSGTLYINVDDNSYLSFFSPYIDQYGGVTVKNVLEDMPSEEENALDYHFHKNILGYRVKEGDCLYWSSFLRHGYSENRTPNRLTLSFNLIPEKFNFLYNIK